MKKKTTIYLFCWIAYLGFSFTFFPTLNITVMLASIPLAMLGGWLYQYKGAVITTLLTIPCHYVLLSVHTHDSSILVETFNPFGISSQLLFSCGAALLKRMQDAHKLLSSSLQDLVKKRTYELEILTNHLLNLSQEERGGLQSALLAKPHAELQSMLSMSQLLLQHLEATHHPSAKAAESLINAIRLCIDNLRNVQRYSSETKLRTMKLEKSLQALAEEMSNVSDATINVIPDTRWNQLKIDHARYLYEIIFEAVSNALKHAQPSTVKVRIDDAENGTVFIIENDGKLFTEDRTEGMGIPLMRYRATKIGGELLIDTAPNGNTRVQCLMPPRRD